MAYTTFEEIVSSSGGVAEITMPGESGKYHHITEWYVIDAAWWAWWKGQTGDTSVWEARWRRVAGAGASHGVSYYVRMTYSMPGANPRHIPRPLVTTPSICAIGPARWVHLHPDADGDGQPDRHWHRVRSELGHMGAMGGVGQPVSMTAEALIAGTGEFEMGVRGWTGERPDAWG